jgi:predicted phosphoribosyltransferase
MKRVYYIAGPMSGIHKYNFPAFRACAAKLRALGLEVVSPHELDEAEGRKDGEVESWEYYLRRDLRVMMERCTDVVVLVDWAQSRGARLEVAVARQLGMPVWREWSLDRVDERLLPEITLR